MGAKRSGRPIQPNPAVGSKPFFDTNVLIYAFRKDPDPRAEVAQGLLSAGGSVSVQILNEFVAVVRRKLGMSWKEVSESLAAIRVLCPDPLAIGLATHESALGIAERYGYSIYDALVIAAALEASCDTLYSEDMQRGHRIRGLTIRNPFAEAGLSSQRPV